MIFSCPHCQTDFPFGPVNREPVLGDMMFCPHCGFWSTFSSDNQWRKPTQQEAIQWANTAHLVDVRQRWEQVNKRKLN